MVEPGERAESVGQAAEVVAARRAVGLPPEGRGESCRPAAARAPGDLGRSLPGHLRLFLLGGLRLPLNHVQTATPVRGTSRARSGS